MLVVWKRSPLLRLLLPFAIGVLMEVYLHPHIAVMMGILLCFGISTLLIHFRRKRLHYNHRHFPAILYSIVLFALGDVLTFASNPQIRNSYFFYHTKDKSYFHVRLLDAPIEKERSVKLMCEVKAVEHDSLCISTSGRLLLYLNKNDESLQLKVDDELVVFADVVSIPTIKNPGEFDYAEYLGNHHVFYQAYVDSTAWQLEQRPQHHSWAGSFIACREYLLHRLKSVGIEEREYAVLAALVLGKSSEIDRDLMNAYAGVGAVHVLAVSGLHVALIYVLLAPLMNRIFPKGRWRLLKTLIPVVLLWIYAGLTGFSPSVLRAALMFTFFIIAENYQKQKNIYNTMSASALLLMIYNPLILLEPGFQLSYMAVLGIVVLQKKITALLFPSGKILNWAWQLTAVSIAAQIATLPITLYYFHQFPNYFLLSNFLVIPLSTLILYMALGFFAMIWYLPIGNFLAQLSAFLTRIMNDLMIWMSSLPYSITDAISITALEALCVSCILVCSCFWFLWIKPAAIKVAMCSVLLLCVSQLVEKKRINEQEEICFHSVPLGACISYLHGDTAFVLASDPIIQDQGFLKFHMAGFWCERGANEIQLMKLPLHGDTSITASVHSPLLHLGDKSVLFVDSVSANYLGEFHCDFYYFGKSSAGVFLNDEMIAGLKSACILLGDGISQKKKNFLWNKLNATCRIFDLHDGAVVDKENSVCHFSFWY